MADAHKTILVLTNDAGLGHRHAALATVAALEQRYGDALLPVLVNPLDEPETPASLHNLQSDFNRIVQKAPLLYSLGHTVGNSYLPTLLLERMEAIFLKETIDQLLTKTEPDIVVTTHPSFIYPLASHRHSTGARWPLAVLVTDLARLQRLWFRKEVDLYLMPTAEAAQLAEQRGIRPERVRVTGIPVDLRLAAPQLSRAEARAAYDWQPDLPVVLAVGSRRVHEFQTFLQALNGSGLPVQLVVITGDDDEMLAEAREIEWRIPAQIHGYVDDMPQRLLAADALITKAGGLSVAGALAAGVPLFIIQSTPMHEQGNAAYVVAGGAGIRAKEPAELVDAVRGSLANECRLLQAMADNARRLGRPRAAYDVAEYLWALTMRSKLGEAAPFPGP